MVAMGTYRAPTGSNSRHKGLHPHPMQYWSRKHWLCAWWISPTPNWWQNHWPQNGNYQINLRNIFLNSSLSWTKRSPRLTAIVTPAEVKLMPTSMPLKPSSDSAKYAVIPRASAIGRDLTGLAIASECRLNRLETRRINSGNLIVGDGSLSETNKGTNTKLRRWVLKMPRIGRALVNNL